MNDIVIKNTRIINRGVSHFGDVWIKNDRIHQIAPEITTPVNALEIHAEGMWLIPGIVDDQVHFREPGLTHKANIATESKAAIAGGVTTFMEMPNTVPGALTQELLQEKYDIAAATSYANYSFFMGVSNDNYDEVMKTSTKDVCGFKIFMGSSTGNMLVDNQKILERVFANAPMLIATHCEDEATIRHNLEVFKSKYGQNITPEMHPLIRNTEGCYISSAKAIEMAQKFNTRLHILHISTSDEVALFRNDIPLAQKRITAEVCVHHLFFDSDMYATLGNLIKCNPAIKSKQDKAALWQALMDDKFDIIATDHAPHTWEEKSKSYLEAPSGLPLVQHSLTIMLDFYHKGLITPERIVEKMCHAPTECFQLAERGYIDEGYKADLVLVKPEESVTVTKENIHYKCGWSPLEGQTFKGSVHKTFINGKEVYNDEGLFVQGQGERLTFDRK